MIACLMHLHVSSVASLMRESSVCVKKPTEQNDDQKCRCEANMINKIGLEERGAEEKGRRKTRWQERRRWEQG